MFLKIAVKCTWNVHDLVEDDQQDFFVPCGKAAELAEHIRVPTRRDPTSTLTLPHSLDSHEESLRCFRSALPTDLVMPLVHRIDRHAQSPPHLQLVRCVAAPI